MSNFKSGRFMKEFCFRTRYNYYKLMSLKDGSEQKMYGVKMDYVKNEMQRNGYTTDDVFEVTALINSLIGLLVFPQQEYYKETYRCSKRTGFEEMYTLQRYVESNNPNVFVYNYFDTYGQKEEVTTANVIRHMRNSVCHERVSIEPISSDRNQITHLKFEDTDKYHNNKFMIKVKVTDLEQLMMEISEYILNAE